MRYLKRLFTQSSKYLADSRGTNPELTVLLYEYQLLKQEIIAVQEFARQSVSTSYVALGILGAGAGFIIERNLQGLFLIFPFFFYGLAWSQVRCTLTVLNIGKHLQEVTVPRIREILLFEDKRHEYTLAMSWETHGKGILRHYGILALPAAGAHYGVMLFGAIISIIAYFVFPPDPPFYDWVFYMLMSANILALIYSIFIGFKAELGR